MDRKASGKPKRDCKSRLGLDFQNLALALNNLRYQLFLPLYFAEKRHLTDKNVDMVDSNFEAITKLVRAGEMGAPASVIISKHYRVAQMGPSGTSGFPVSYI